MWRLNIHYKLQYLFKEFFELFQKGAERDYENIHGQKKEHI